jgi:hypothetical protein
MNAFSARWRYLFVLAMLAAGCGGAEPDPGDGQVAAGGGGQPAAAVSVAGGISNASALVESNSADPSAGGARASGGQWQKLSMITIRDNRGRVIAEAPYPAGWDLKSPARPGEPSITGPGGVIVTDQPLANYVHVTDPYFVQLYARSGQKLREWPGAEQLVMQDFVPSAAAQGWKLKKWYEVPEIARIDQWYNDQLYKAAPMENEALAIGTEWESADGSPAFMLSHVILSRSSTMDTWSYYSSVLKAERGAFEAAKKQFVFSLANTRYALEPIAEYNRMEAEKAGRSWAEHNARMARNQAAFEARQRDFVNRSNAINDSIMSGWRSGDAASDRQQAGRIDSIREEENSYSASGDQHKTSIHYNNYWLSSDGRYLSTNQNEYDPNRDDSLNSQSWEKLTPQNR